MASALHTDVGNLTKRKFVDAKHAQVLPAQAAVYAPMVKTAALPVKLFALTVHSVVCCVCWAVFAAGNQCRATCLSTG